MNRMGGVGRGRSQFNVAGVNHPDGTRRCTPFRANNNISRNIYNVRTAVAQAKAYAKSQGKILCLVGTHETVEGDLGVSNGTFIRLGNHIPGVAVLNSLGLVYNVKGKPQKHIAAMVTREIAIKLINSKFGIDVGYNLNLIAFSAVDTVLDIFSILGSIGQLINEDVVVQIIKQKVINLKIDLIIILI